MTGEGNGHGDVEERYPFLTPHHVDSLVECMRGLSITIAKLDVTVQKQTILLSSQDQSRRFDHEQVTRIERLEDRIEQIAEAVLAKRPARKKRRR